MNEKAIAERVAKSMTAAGIKVPAYGEIQTQMYVDTNAINISTIKAGKYKNDMPLVRLDVSDVVWLDADQLDTFIDTLKSAQRRM